MAQNTRRWQIFQAIEKLQGTTSKSTLTPGKPQLTLCLSARSQPQETDYIVEVTNSDVKIVCDATPTEGVWSSKLTTFGYFASCEAHRNANVAWGNLNSPSYTQAWVASMPRGLAILTEVNHMEPKGIYRYDRKDDDPKMMHDDSVSVFFALPDGEICQLSHNAAGAKTFFRNGKVIPAKDILIFQKTPINKSGGSLDKVLIPWEYFGLKKQPSSGTVWKFNVGRRLAACRDEVMAHITWAPLSKSFYETDKWGRLMFAGKHAEKVILPPSITVEPNYISQVISGNDVHYQLQFRPGTEERANLRIVVQHESGRSLKMSKLLNFGAYVFIISTDGLEKGNWSIRFYCGKESLQKSNLFKLTVMDSPWIQ